MIRATYVRTLKPGTTDQEFIHAWMPDGTTIDTYPARVSIGRSIADPDQVISVFEVDVPPERMPEVLPTLVHPESEARLAVIVHSTQLESLAVETCTFGAPQRHE